MLLIRIVILPIAKVADVASATNLCCPCDVFKLDTPLNPLSLARRRSHRGTFVSGKAIKSTTEYRQKSLWMEPGGLREGLPLCVNTR